MISVCFLCQLEQTVTPTPQKPGRSRPLPDPLRSDELWNELYSEDAENEKPGMENRRAHRQRHQLDINNPQETPVKVCLLDPCCFSVHQIQIVSPASPCECILLQPEEVLRAKQAAEKSRLRLFADPSKVPTPAVGRHRRRAVQNQRQKEEEEHFHEQGEREHGGRLRVAGLPDNDLFAVGTLQTPVKVGRKRGQFLDSSFVGS